MVSRSYVWLATGGGAWSLASNWDDLTDGIDPSLTAPGPQDSVSVSGATGEAATVLTGSGAALAAAFFNNISLAGSFTFGGMALGTDFSGGLLTIGAGAKIASQSGSFVSGSVLVSGVSAAMDLAGTLTLGGGQSGYGAAPCNLDATNGGRIQAASLILDASAAALYVDPTSAIEIGTQGGALPGALTIDAGASMSGQGDANGYALTINDGTITASGGDLLLGAISGTGTILIDSDSALTLNGATGAGQSVVFAGAESLLALSTEFDEPQGSVAGFAAGDGIDLLGSPISAASYAPTGNDTGILTLYYGNQVADTLTLLGDFTGDVFLTAPDGAGGTLITVSPETSGTGNPSSGTNKPDQYLWTAAGSGNWKLNTNWEDVTAGESPALVAPGVNNFVTINAAQAGSFTVIAGPANAASLAVTGDLALVGAFAIGTLTMGVGGSTMQGGAFDLLPGSQMTVATLAIQDGSVAVTGAATMAVSGAIALGGGESGIGLPITGLSATAGGTITCTALTLGGGSGNTVTTDPTGSIEIGTAGGAATGAVTIDPGASLAGNGEVNPYGAIIDNGTITATGGTLVLGAVTGTGGLSIADGSALVLTSGTALGITFQDNNGILATADELVPLTGTITGFTIGDAIDIQNDPITAAVGRASGNNTILTLYYGSTAVETLTLAGTYTTDRFFVVPDGGYGTDILVEKGSGNGGNGGQGDTDLLSWANPVSGIWNKAANWFDITTNSAATAPPGTLNTVQIVGPQGQGFQTIGGPAACATLAFFGNTFLNGAFTTGSLTIGGLPSGMTTLTQGLADLGSATSITATAALITDGGIIVGGANATLTVAGTLTLGGGAPDADGPAALLSAAGGATVQVNALTMGGGSGDTLECDVASSIEIGTLGGAALNAVTIDPGMEVAGNGDLNENGNVVVNGTLTALGGTLITGSVTGAGMLDIGATATLELAGTEACAIDMAGAGAILLLAGSEETPAGLIENFGQGDLIITGSSQIGSVAYAPGAGDVGTLSLIADSQVTGTLLLAGDFSGDTFFVEPDGEGSAIAVQANTGPSGGTTTPDHYAWVGSSNGSWNTANNWSDITTGQDPAAIAPGVNDLVTIQGGASSYTTITGPANAATLTLLGEVALNGQFAAGGLAIGQGSKTGLLALGSGSALTAAQAAVTGGLIAQGGVFLCTGTTTLQSGVLIAAADANLETATLTLAGIGDDVSVDATSRLEIGSARTPPAQGNIQIDAGAVLQGDGVLSAAGDIVDDGTLTALGETQGASLSFGNVSGTGTLLVGVGGTLLLQGSAAASLLIDFAGPGTLSIASTIPQAAIAGFGDGDAIIAPVSGITGETYVPTAPNVGLLTLMAGNQVAATLTLVGIGLGQGFSVAGASGGTIVTTETTQYGGGGSTMTGGNDSSGGGQTGVISDFAFWQDLPDYVQEQLAAFQEDVGGTSYVYSSPDGSYFGNYQPGYANFAVISDPPSTVAGDVIALPPGYDALLAQGNVPLTLTDGSGNNALIMGNAANDSIVGYGGNDTLVGGIGGNSVIWANGQDTIYGNGNDSIITTLAPCDVTTSATGTSIVFAGPAANTIALQGTDELVAVAGNGANDTVTASGSDTVFAPSTGLLTFNGGAGTDVVVGDGSQIQMTGGVGNGSSLWCGTSSVVNYFGGGGSAAIIGGTGFLSVQGGAGALTLFGGTGNTVINGEAGPSRFLVGEGASTVTAASGNLVWLVGAANDSLVASGGNVTLWGANSTGDNVFQAGSGPCTISGGMGNDTLIGGSGTAIMYGGGGANTFAWTSGLAGGAVTITDFNTAADQIDLHGYSGYSSAVVDGNEVLSLSDGTTITLDDVTSLAGVAIHQS
jgi:hypothetical protein